MIITGSSAAVRSVSACAGWRSTSSCHQWSRPASSARAARARHDDHVAYRGDLRGGCVGDRFQRHTLCRAGRSRRR